MPFFRSKRWNGSASSFSVWLAGTSAPMREVSSVLWGNLAHAKRQWSFTASPVPAKRGAPNAFTNSERAGPTILRDSPSRTSRSPEARSPALRRRRRSARSQRATGDALRRRDRCVDARPADAMAFFALAERGYEQCPVIRPERQLQSRSSRAWVVSVATFFFGWRWSVSPCRRCASARGTLRWSPIGSWENGVRPQGATSRVVAPRNRRSSPATRGRETRESSSRPWRLCWPCRTARRSRPSASVRFSGDGRGRYAAPARLPSAAVGARLHRGGTAAAATGPEPRRASSRHRPQYAHAQDQDVWPACRSGGVGTPVSTSRRCVSRHRIARSIGCPSS